MGAPHCCLKNGAICAESHRNCACLPSCKDCPNCGIPHQMAARVETRTSCATTGGEKGVKPEKFSLVPAEPMKAVARVYGYGAKKYTKHAASGEVISSGEHNWRKGYEWSKALDALERHLNAYKACQDTDHESGESHLAHVVFHCLSLMEWSKTHPELDDRYREPK